MMNNFDTAKINDVVEKETLEKMYNKHNDYLYI